MWTGQHHGARQAATAGGAAGVRVGRRQRQGAARIPVRAVRHLQRARRQEVAIHQPHLQLQSSRAGTEINNNNNR